MKLDVDSLAFELKEDAKIIEDVVKNYELFEIKNGTFYSSSLKKRMKHLDSIREARKRGGKKRWQKEKEGDGGFRKP